MQIELFSLAFEFLFIEDIAARISLIKDQRFGKEENFLVKQSLITTHSRDKITH